jgi:hypothetical protein
MPGPVEGKQTKDKTQQEHGRRRLSGRCSVSRQLVIAAMTEYSRKARAGGKLDWEIGYRVRREHEAKEEGSNAG